MLKKVTNFKLPKEFQVVPNLNLLAQVNHVYEKMSHTGLRKTKTRAEVNRTGKKIYRQKGTGGARHGSRRAPIYVGGGVAHGPQPVKKLLVLPKRIKRLAKLMALSLANIIVAGGFSTLSKTREVKDFLQTLNGKRFLFLLSEKNKTAASKIRNLEGVMVKFFKDANAFDILNGGILIIDNDVFKEEKNND